MRSRGTATSGQVYYERHGDTYSEHRRADPYIASRIHAALGPARTVVNVGAGTGSYEPTDRWVLAVEPSSVMRAQRPAGAAPALAARAEALSFDDDTFDAGMACLTVHHWEDRALGLSELRRVVRGPVVILTFDLDRLPEWQLEFFEEPLAAERPRFGSIDDVAAELGGRVRIETVETPAECEDGFIQAFWRRPEAMLDPGVRGAQSVWALLEPGVEERIVGRLKESLDSGDWDARFGHLRSEETNDGGVRLIVSEPV
jgi:SAM-dependent methyltransferase